LKLIKHLLSLIEPGQAYPLKEHEKRRNVPMQIPTECLINIPHEFIEIICSRSINEELVPQKWPVSPPNIRVPYDFREFCSSITDTITSGPGFTVLRFENDYARTPHLLKTCYWNLFTFLAKPLPQYKTGELTFDVRETANQPINNHYSQSNRGSGFHTDGTFLPETPLYVGLGCIEQAIYGGESVLIDGRAIYQELSIHHPHVLKNLEKEYYFDCCDQLPEVEVRKKAVICKEGASILVQYLRLYIVQGHCKSRISIETDSLESFDEFDNLMEMDIFQYRYKLSPCEMLLFNNRCFLHGRNSFTDDLNSNTASKRWFMRIYGSVR
jgi:hypothetical protein